MRDSHSLTRFAGINTVDSPANVKPNYARDCNNVIGGSDGQLWQARLTRILIDMGLEANVAADIAPISSIGVLDTTGLGNPPRLVIQEGADLFFADAPGYAPVSPYVPLSNQAPQIPGRLDYAQVANVLYFSSGKWGGKVLPNDDKVYNWGLARPVTAPTFVASTSFTTGATVQRTGGVVTVTFPVVPTPAPFVGDPLLVATDPAWPDSFAGTFPITSVAGPVVTYAQPGLPDSGPFTQGAYTGITLATGRQYYISFGFSKTGHWSTVSPLSASTGPVTNQSPTILSPVPADLSVDQIAVFANLDGGGDWFLTGIYPLPAAGPFPRQIAVADITPDDLLQTSAQTPPYDNGVSPNGKYLCAWLDRTLMCGIEGDEESLAFSGVESINFGRAQESWPLFNSIAIGQGEAIPNAIGVCRYGAVVFCRNQQLYLIRGNLTDQTTSAITSLNFSVQDYKFRIGNYSHYATQSTPVGIIFVNDALQLMTFDGYFPPSRIAPVLDGLFKRITPGLADIWDSTFIASTDRMWYVLSIPVDGSPVNNKTIIVDLTQDENRNSGVWVTDHSIDFIRSILHPDASWHLICAQRQLDNTADPGPTAGLITELPHLFAPGDALMPNAHWLSGYIGVKDEDGVDEWAYIKVFRFIRLATAAGFRVTAYLVDGDEYTFDNPLVQILDSEGDGPISINHKARAVSLDLQFPDQASGDPLTVLNVSWNFCGKR